MSVAVALILRPGDEARLTGAGAVLDGGGRFGATGADRAAGGRGRAERRDRPAGRGVAPDGDLWRSRYESGGMAALGD